MMQHLLFVGLRQLPDCGKGTQETLEVWDDGGDLGLLQHDLADPDGIGIARGAQGRSRA